MHNPKGSPRGELIAMAQRSVEEILQRARTSIDTEFGQHYAVKNPDFTAAIARIMFEEVQALRPFVHSGGTPS